MKAIIWFYSIFKHEEGFKVEFRHLEEKSITLYWKNKTKIEHLYVHRTPLPIP